MYCILFQFETVFIPLNYGGGGSAIEYSLLLKLKYFSV